MHTRIRFHTRGDLKSLRHPALHYQFWKTKRTFFASMSCEPGSLGMLPAARRATRDCSRISHDLTPVTAKTLYLTDGQSQNCTQYRLIIDQIPYCGHTVALLQPQCIWYSDIVFGDSQPLLVVVSPHDNIIRAVAGSPTSSWEHRRAPYVARCARIKKKSPKKCRWGRLAPVFYCLAQRITMACFARAFSGYK